MLSPYPLVLLHGWGFDRRVWQSLLPELQKSFSIMLVDLPGFGESEQCKIELQSAVDQLNDVLPAKSILLGWSLGGMLATSFAVAYPSRVAALITVGSNLKWLAEIALGEDSWTGMPEDNFQQFFQNMKEQPAVTRKRFAGLISKGDINEKQLLSQLRKLLADVPGENLLQALLLLTEIDNRQSIKKLNVPGLHIFGEQDVLVPLAVARYLMSMTESQQAHVMTDMAHAPFLSDPDEFIFLVKSFIQQQAYRIDKARVARSFSRAAETYDAAAALQRQIGDRLFNKMLENQSAPRPEVLLDMGCGTGTYTQKLRGQFSESLTVSLDIAEGMLAFAEQKNGEAGFNGLCGDAESLPLAENSIDYLYSNLAIQWCQNLNGLFQQVYDCLRPGGKAFISTFQDGTLFELREAWEAVDSRSHVNHFFSVEEVSESLFSVGFTKMQIGEEKIVQYYDSVKELTTELKDIGAHNLNQGQAVGLTSRTKLKQFIQAYESHRDSNNKIPASYQVLYLELEK